MSAWFLEQYYDLFTRHSHSGLTPFGRTLTSRQWVERAIDLAQSMDASEECLSKFDNVMAHVDFKGDFEPLFQSLFTQLAYLDEVARFVDGSAPVSVFSIAVEKAFYYSSPTDLGALLTSAAAWGWEPPSVLVRDVLAHTVYNNFSSEQLIGQSCAVFLRCCSAGKIIEAVGHPDFDLRHSTDTNWEESFVCGVIDEMAQEWSAEEQKQLLDAAAPKPLFPQTAAWAQRERLSAVVDPAAARGARKL